MTVTVWDADKANKWYSQVGAVRGCNYVPSTVVNSTEMWQGETFEADVIDREFGWAKDCGYNSVRVFLQYVVWKADPSGFKQRFDTFLSLADTHGLSVTPIPFCDCRFSGRETYTGKQAEPVPGVHNSQWVASPGHSAAHDLSMRPELEEYIKDIIGSFADDRRVLMWDLYNEPGMSGAGEKSYLLVEEAFKWAREVGPRQPITTGAYQTSLADEAPQRIMELSDIITFHSYEKINVIKERIKVCQKFNKPIMCTEFMARIYSDFFDCLPVFAENNIGWYNWGLVKGRTQTYMPWGSKEGDPEPERWFHGVLYTDGRPYDKKEVELIKNFKFV